MSKAYSNLRLAALAAFFLVTLALMVWFVTGNWRQAEAEHERRQQSATPASSATPTAPASSTTPAAAATPAATSTPAP